MRREEIEGLLEDQRKFFKSGETLPVSFRLKYLYKLYQIIKRREAEIIIALKKDLGKSAFESYMSEIGLALSEISYMLRHTEKFARRRYVRTPFAQLPAVSYSQPVPFGNVLILSPWNYPFLLAIDPVVDAIAAGNTAIVKPSAYAPETSRVVESVIKECFPPEYVSVVTGGREENKALLEQKFDFILFTGSGAVGKEVLRKAAEHLTPVLLELGGKSPCIVDKSANLKLAAKRIVFGKFLNCGQTCVAPDYILCEAEIKDLLLAELRKQIKKQFGEAPLFNEGYGKIINKKHFSRLCSLLDPEKVVLGGEYDEQSLKIVPTLMDKVTFEDAVMKEEIFGPILPILTFDSFETVCEDLKEKAKPLALYLFSSNRVHIKKVTTELSYGGGCINDVVIHLATDEMGFGGVGESGMGSYHGRAGFEAFSHRKSIVDKKTWIDLPMRYQPYKHKIYEKMIRMFLK